MNDILVVEEKTKKKQNKMNLLSIAKKEKK